MKRGDRFHANWIGHIRHLEAGYWYEHRCEVCQLSCKSTGPDATPEMRESLAEYERAQKSGVARISYRTKKSKAAGA